MSNVLNKLKKRQKEKEKYSYISTFDLEKMKNRGIELSNEIRCIDFVKDPIRFKELSLELHTILNDLRLYKKYAKK